MSSSREVVEGQIGRLWWWGGLEGVDAGVTGLDARAMDLGQCLGSSAGAVWRAGDGWMSNIGCLVVGGWKGDLRYIS